MGRVETGLDPPDPQLLFVVEIAGNTVFLLIVMPLHLLRVG
jgi:hypothetical protein